MRPLQTDTQTWVTTIHFLSSMTHAKCNKLLHYYILSVLAVCVDSRIHHSGHHHRRLKDTAVGRHLGHHGDNAPHVPNCGWQVFTVINCCCWISYHYPLCYCATLFLNLFFDLLVWKALRLSSASWSLSLPIGSICCHQLFVLCHHCSVFSHRACSVAGPMVRNLSLDNPRPDVFLWQFPEWSENISLIRLRDHVIMCCINLWLALTLTLVDCRFTLLAVDCACSFVNLVSKIGIKV